MSLKVIEQVLRRSAYSLEIELSIASHKSHDDSGYYSNAFSSNISIDDRTEFQVMFLWLKSSDAPQGFIKFSKVNTTDEESYQIDYEHHKKNESKTIAKQYTVDDTWHSVENFTMPASYIVKVTNKLAPLSMSYAAIHEDTEVVDLELRGVDGSVHIHKAVAAACSPFFKTLFSGSWRETANDVVVVPDASVATLQQLKDYMYLGKVPETVDVKKLILLSSCYLMPDLEKRCAYELCKSATAESVLELIQFSASNNLSQLLFEILFLVQSGRLDVNVVKKLKTED